MQDETAEPEGEGRKHKATLIRWTAEEYSAAKKAAEAEGMAFETFCRRAVLRTSMRVKLLTRR